MDKVLETIKARNPELAEKMKKVNDRMSELREAGTDMRTAMETIGKEFGQPDEKEMAEVSAALSQVRSSSGGGSLRGRLDVQA